MGNILSGYNYERPTYQTIVDAFKAEYNLQNALTDIDEGTWVFWILNAESEIASEFNVEHTHKLRLRGTYPTYHFTENPRVVTISRNAGDGSITIETEGPHRLDVGDYLRMAWATGFSGVNDCLLYVTEDTDATHFKAMRVVRITGATNADPSSLTVTDHGYESGVVTIAGALGNTSINGTWTPTLVDANTLTVPVAGNGEYTSGGYMLIPFQAFVDTYVGGARIYRETELPSYLSRLTKVVLYDGAVITEPILSDVNALEDETILDAAILGGDALHTHPIKVRCGNLFGERTLTFYPAPASDMDCLVKGRLSIDPMTFREDDIECATHLQAGYEKHIRRYLRYTTLNSMPGKEKEALLAFNAFNSGIGRVQRKTPSTVNMRITYT